MNPDATMNVASAETGLGAPPGRTHEYNAVRAMILNIVQIVCGGLVCISSFFTASTFIYDDHPLIGLRSGSLYLIAGIVGLMAAKYKTYGFIIPNMTMSILAAIVTASLFAMQSLALMGLKSSHGVPAVTIVGLVIGYLISIAELVASIWVSILSGNVVCPCRGVDRGGSGRVFTDYRSALAKSFGIIHIVLSVFLLILGIALFVVVAVSQKGHYESSPYLAGTVLMLFPVALPAGILGIVSASKKTLPPIIAHMVLCIYCAVSSGAILLIACPITISFQARYTINASDIASIVVIVLIMLVSLAEFIISIWSSSLTCRVTCCGIVDTAKRIYKTYNKLVGLIIGTVLIVCGLMGIAAGLAFPFLLRKGSSTFGPLTAIVFIAAGSFAIKASKTKTRSMVITQWVFSLLCILMAVTQFSYGVQSLATGVMIKDRTSGRGDYGLLIAEGIVFLLLSLTEFAAALVGAMFCYLATRADAFAYHGLKAQSAAATTPA